MFVGKILYVTSFSEPFLSIKQCQLLPQKFYLLLKQHTRFSRLKGEGQGVLALSDESLSFSYVKRSSRHRWKLLSVAWEKIPTCHPPRYGNSPENNSLLKKHQEIRGPFPRKMLKHCSCRDIYFDGDFNFLSFEKDQVKNMPKITLFVIRRERICSAGQDSTRKILTFPNLSLSRCQGKIPYV